MMDDDLAPLRPTTLTGIQVGDDLTALSEHELQERVALLEQEISRTNETLRQKKDVRANADAFFGKST